MAQDVQGGERRERRDLSLGGVKRGGDACGSSSQGDESTRNSSAVVFYFPLPVSSD